MITCADSALNQMLQQSGWRNVKNPPDRSYFFHGNNGPFHSYSYTVAAADYGFEAIGPIPRDK